MASVIFLLEPGHQKPPATLKPQEICGENIIVEDEGEYETVQGVVFHIFGEVAELQDYLRGLGPVWTSNNPMAGSWEKLSVPEKASA